MVSSRRNGVRSVRHGEDQPLRGGVMVGLGHGDNIRPRRRIYAALIALLTATALLPLIAPSASAASDPASGTQTTLEGCNNPGGLTLPNGSGDFICPTADYTTGNLGKNWSELDLVPLRVTVSASQSTDASSTFSFAVAVDNTNAGHVGFDFLSAPVLNTDT